MLNVALILFGWRRYVDLLHEAEMRADGELRAAVLASTDTITGLTPGTVYYFAVTAYDTSAIESEPSNEVSK